MPLRRTNLPTMETKSYAEVMGTVKLGISRKKLTAVFGTPGSGKSSLLNDIELEHANAHVILCSPTMTMKNLLVQIANKINTHVKGDTYSVQQQLTEALIADPKHILLFDECEYLHRGNVSKIDVLRQIYDESNIPMVLCGTYQLQTLLSGQMTTINRKSSGDSSRQNSNLLQKRSSQNTLTPWRNSLSYALRLMSVTSCSHYVLMLKMADWGSLSIFWKTHFLLSAQSGKKSASLSKSTSLSILHS